MREIALIVSEKCPNVQDFSFSSCVSSCIPTRRKTAGSGNRTRMACLEGRNFTTKLYPRNWVKIMAGCRPGQAPSFPGRIHLPPHLMGRGRRERSQKSGSQRLTIHVAESPGFCPGCEHADFQRRSSRERCRSQRAGERGRKSAKRKEKPTPCVSGMPRLPAGLHNRNVTNTRC